MTIPKRISSLLLLMILTTATLRVAVAFAASPDDFFKQGLASYQSKDFSKASKNFEAAYKAYIKAGSSQKAGQAAYNQGLCLLNLLSASPEATSKALSAFENSNNAYKKAGDSNAAANAVIQMANICMRIGDLTRAWVLYFDVSQTPKIAPLLTGMGYEGLGKISFQQGSLINAKDYYNKAIDCFKGNLAAELQIKLQQGAVFRKIGDIEKASEIFKSVKSESEQKLAKDPKNKNLASFLTLLAWAEMGTTSLRMGWFDQAKAELNEAKKLSEAIKAQDNLYWQIEQNIAIVEGQIGDLKKAEATLLSAVAAARAGKMLELEINVLISLGQLARMDGKVEEALDRYLEAQRKAKEAKLDNRLVEATIQIGDIYYSIGNWEQSRINYLQGFVNSLLQGDMEALFASMMGLARLQQSEDMGLSGKLDYRNLSGMAWRGIEKLNQNSVKRDEALSATWKKSMDGAKTFFSQPLTLSSFLYIFSAAEMSGWNRMAGKAAIFLGDGVLRLCRARLDAAEAATQAICGLSAIKEKAQNPVLADKLLEMALVISRRCAGEKLLTDKIENIQIQTSGILIEGEEPASSGDPNAQVMSDIKTIAEIPKRLSLKQREIDSIMDILQKGEDMPLEIRQRLLSSFANYARERASEMEKSSASMDYTPDLKSIVIDFEPRKKRIDEVVNTLSGRTPAFIVTRMASAKEMAQFEEAWNRMALRVVLLKKLGVTPAKSKKWEDFISSLAKSIQDGSREFNKRFDKKTALSSSQLAVDSADEMLAIAQALALKEIEREKTRCMSFLSKEKNSNNLLSYEDMLYMKELTARMLLEENLLDEAKSAAEAILDEIIPGYSQVHKTGETGIAFPDVLWRAHILLARVLRAEDNLNEALKEFTTASKIMESINPSQAGESQTTSDRLDSYLNAVSVAFEIWKNNKDEGNLESLWKILESMKSRQWREMLSTTGGEFLRRMPEEEQKRYRALKTELTGLEGNYNYAASVGPNENKNKYALWMQQTREKLNYLTSKWTVDSPSEPPATTDIRKGMPEDWAVVDYYISRSCSFAFLLTKNSDPKIIELPLDYDSFFGFSTRIRERLRNYDDVTLLREILKTDLSMCGITARELYDQLFSPIADELGNIKNVLIIPHDMLYVFPLEILVVSGENDKGNHFLLDDYTFAEIPSAFLLTEYSSKTKKSPEKQALVIANPRYFTTFQKGMNPPKDKLVQLEEEKLKSIEETNGELAKKIKRLSRVAEEGKFSGMFFLGALDNSQYEAEMIANIFDIDASGDLLGLRENASEKFLYSHNLEDYKIIHLACHGYDRNSIPLLQPGLALSPLKDPNNDSFAQMGELASLKWNSDLVVLSACNTGLGELFVGDGMIGLSTVLLAGGNKGIVVSRWLVSDESAPYFMKVMYSQIKEGKTPVEAVQNAKLNLAKGEEFVLPNHWAVFKYVGTPW